MTSKTFKAKIVREGSMCFIPLTFDPKVVFGKVRAPVKVTLNGYTYRSTIAAMGGPACVPLRKSNREAAGLEGGETIDVRLDLDTDKREVTPPADFLRALRAVRGVRSVASAQLHASAGTRGSHRRSQKAGDARSSHCRRNQNAPRNGKEA